MAKNKGKKQFQGKGQRFRGDMWLDQKVSARTLHALQSSGVKFPEGINPRKTKEFKEEYKKQGVNVHLFDKWNTKIDDYDLIHFFKVTIDNYGLMVYASRTIIYSMQSVWERICTYMFHISP
jgi:hypothetical protein